MSTYIIYAILGLLVVFPGSLLGGFGAKNISGLSYYEDEFAKKRKPIWRTRNAIFIVAVEIIIVALVYLGVLSSTTHVILSAIGLFIVGVILGYFWTHIFIKRALAANPKLKEQVESFTTSRKQIDRIFELEKRKQGTPTTKVFRCGICGDFSIAGQYVTTQKGMMLCPKHAHISSSKSYECPSCGYKFDPGNNVAYFNKHLCLHCGRELNDSSWEGEPKEHSN